MLQRDLSDQEWKRSLTRAVSIMRLRVLGEEQWHRDVELRRDLRGHAIASSEDGSHSFSSKCFIALRARDRKWILSKPCLFPERAPRDLHEEYEHDGHRATHSLHEDPQLGDPH